MESIAIPVEAAERVMIDRLCGELKTFYDKPENVKAFEAWKKAKEKI